MDSKVIGQFLLVILKLLSTRIVVVLVLSVFMGCNNLLVVIVFTSSCFLETETYQVIY